MNINPTMGVQPNFQAKLRQNDTLKTFVDGMSNSEYKTYKKTLSKLENVSPSDTLELYKKDNEEGCPGVTYYMRNLNKAGSDTMINSTLGIFADTKEFLNILKKVVMPNTKETETMLTEPATKDQRSFGEKLGDFFSKGDDNDPTCYRY